MLQSIPFVVIDLNGKNLMLENFCMWGITINFAIRKLIM